MPNDGKVDLVIQAMVSSCPSLSLSHSYTEARPPPLPLPFFFFLLVIPRRNVKGV